MSIVITDGVSGFDGVQKHGVNQHDVAAFAVLREQLIKNIGIERVKGFLLRYGYELGSQTAKRALQLNLSSIAELIKQGPQFHSTYGHAKGVLYRIEIEVNEQQRPITARGNGTWKGSFEGLEHLSRLGKSDAPVCYTLTGYISGYMSALCQRVIVAKEISCVAMGDELCRWEFKPLEEWGEEIHDEYRLYFESPIIQEYEYTYEQLLEQRNYMYKVANLHQQLTEAIANGCDLQYVAKITHEITGIPVIISDVHFQTFAYHGLSEEQLTDYMKSWGKIHRTKCTGQPFITEIKLYRFREQDQLIAPIVVKKKTFGYCAFIYGNKQPELEKDYMLLERAANAAALYLLNEKTSFDASERMKGHFLEQLMDKQYGSRAEILTRGRFMNIDLSGSIIVAVLKADVYRTPFQEDFILREQVLERTRNFFREKHQKFLSVQKQENIVLLIPFENDKYEHIFHSLEELVSCLEKEFPGLRYKIGVSSRGKQIEDVSESYQEALIASRMACKKKVVSYDELGIAGILVNSHNVQSIRVYAEKLLGPLYKNEDSKMKELLKTLYVFLLNGGKLEQTMKDLSLSMSGLLYRVRKIETILGKDLRDPMNGHQIFLVLQALAATGDLEIF